MGNEARQSPGFLARLLAGAAIGLGGILPGVSGGMLAVSFGLYRPMLDALAGFRRQPRREAAYLLPLALGIGVGLLVGSMLLDWLIARYLVPLLFLFIGLICGGLPAFIGEANEGGFRPRYLLAALGGALLASLLLLLEQAGQPLASGALVLSPLQAIIAGAVIAFGTVVPGISTSIILIYLGWYAAVISAIGNLKIITLLWLVLGFVVCGLLTIKLVRWLFDRFHGFAYYAVLGFLLVSLIVIFPNSLGDTAKFSDALFILPGLVGGYLCTRPFRVRLRG
jgi:putative membrane protein